MHGKSEWCMIQAQHLACSEQTKRAISFLLNHKMIPTFHSEFAPELTGTLPHSTVPLTTWCVDSLVGRGCLRHLSDDQNPDCLFYIWDYTTQSYTVEIIKRNYMDSYEPTTTMECHRDFERCWVGLQIQRSKKALWKSWWKWTQACSWAFQENLYPPSQRDTRDYTM